MASQEEIERDYYRVLAVENVATAVEITRAFRRLALQKHPDKNPVKEATQDFQLLNEAYEVLSDPIKRATYDAIVRKPAARKHQSQSPPESPTQQSRPQPSAAQQAPNARNRWRFGSSRPRQAPKPEGSSKTKAGSEAWESQSEAIDTEKLFFLGERVYGDGRNRIGARTFHLTPVMIARGERVVRTQEAEDREAEEDKKITYSKFVYELRKNSVLSDEAVEALWKSDLEKIAYCEKQKESSEKRRKGYFKNAFPELLGSDETLPNGWERLWEVFSRDFRVEIQDGLSGLAKKRGTLSDLTKAREAMHAQKGESEQESKAKCKSGQAEQSEVKKPDVEKCDKMTDDNSWLEAMEEAKKERMEKSRREAQEVAESLAKL